MHQYHLGVLTGYVAAQNMPPAAVLAALEYLSKTPLVNNAEGEPSGIKKDADLPTEAIKKPRKNAVWSPERRARQAETMRTMVQNKRMALNGAGESHYQGEA